MTASPEVREAMLAALPSLRAFALSLTNAREVADDLVQDTLVRALANIDQFEPGTNLGAWLFTILRHQFYSQCRRAKHEVEDPDGSMRDAFGHLRSSMRIVTSRTFVGRWPGLPLSSGRR